MARIVSQVRQIWDRLAADRKRWHICMAAAFVCGIGLLGLLDIAGENRTISASAGINPGEISPGAYESMKLDDTYFTRTGCLTLLFEEDAGETYLRKNLTTCPPLPFEVTRVTGQVYSLRFDSGELGEDLTVWLQAPTTYLKDRKFTISATPARTQGLQAKLIGQTPSQGITETTPLVVAFSGEINQAAVEKALWLDGVTDVGITCGNNLAVVQPARPLEPGKAYTLRVAAGMKDKNGEATVLDYEGNFQIVGDALPVQAAVPGQVSGTLTVDTMLAPGNYLSVNGGFTLIFSDTVTADKLEKYLTISNREEGTIPYTVTCKQNVAVVRPQQLLKYGAEYQLDISQGLTGETGSRMSAAFKSTLQTEQAAFSLAVLNQDAHSIPLGSPITMTYQLDNQLAPQTLLDVRIFRFNNYDQYLTALTMDEISTSFSLTELSAQSVVLENGKHEVELESPEGGGFYLIKTTYADPKVNEMRSIYKCVNLVELSVYMQTVDGETTLWVNHVGEQTPAAGYRVVFSRRKTGEELAAAVTDGQGVAVMSYAFKETDDQRETLLTIFDPQGNPKYLDTTQVFGGSEYEYRSQNERYYSFFYLDRALYHPTDEVNFWGFVRPRDTNKQAMPGTVQVIFDQGGLHQAVDAALLPDGTFTGKIPLEQIKSGQYEVSAGLTFPPETGEKEPRTQSLDGAWVEVKEFQKPMFTISASVDKELYFSGEQVQLTAMPTFFDGTPLPDYPMDVSLMDEEGNTLEKQKIRTDEQGVARVTMNPPRQVGEEVSSAPIQCYYLVQIQNDGETINQHGSYSYLASKLVFKAAASPAPDGNLALTVHAAQVDDRKKITQEQLWEATWRGGSDEALYNLLAGAPADVDVTARVEADYRTEQGEYRQESKVFPMRTAGGVGQKSGLLEFPLDTRDYASAYCTLTFVDNNLNAVGISTNWYNQAAYTKEEEKEPPKGYMLRVFKNGSGVPCDEILDYVDFSMVNASAGDQLAFRLYLDGKPVAAQAEGKLLYGVVQDGTVERDVAPGQSFNLTQKVNYANNMYLFTAYFDGRMVYPIRDIQVQMEQESLALNLEVTADKESYRPGDTASLQVRVTDSKGAPVAGNLCLSVVDEAVFALRDQTVSVLNQLYGGMYFSVYDIRKYTTSQGDIPRETFGGDGGKGGNPMDAYDVYRKDFKDTALFVPLTIGADGRAAASFKLPDNLTTWRITTACVGENLFGGEGKDQLVTSMPFFASPILSPKYLEGDDVAMLLQGHGTAVTRESEISYQVQVLGDGVEQNHTLQAAAYHPAELKLGKLPVGEYTVISTATLGGYRDTVELPLSVISSNLELVVHKEVDLNRISETKAVRYPVVISLYDQAHEAFYKSVSSLLTHYCNRADQRMSRFAAKRALSKYSDPAELPQHIAVTDYTTGEMQNEDGGIGWYPGEPSDAILTVKLLLFAGDQYNPNRMRDYFRKEIKLRPDTLTAAVCYAGLAELDSEVAKEIHTILKNRPVMPLEQKLYYITGLACAGDRENALAAYREAVDPYLTASGGGKKLIYTRQENEDDKLTAAAWITASILGLEDADHYALYFADNSWRVSTAFECMIYVTRYNKQVTAMPAFTYTTNGQTQTVDLGITGQKSITFTKSAFEGLSFQTVPAGLTAMAYYIGEPSEVDIKPSDQLHVSKSMAAKADGIYETTLTVEFGKDAPMGNYDISDWVPSSMRFSGMDNGDQNTYRLEQEGQKLYFGIYRQDEQTKTVKIVYQTRKTFDTQAVIDRVYVIHADTGINAYSEKGMAP